MQSKFLTDKVFDIRLKEKYWYSEWRLVRNILPCLCKLVLVKLQKIQYRYTKFGKQNCILNIRRSQIIEIKIEVIHDKIEDFEMV